TFDVFFKLRVGSHLPVHHVPEPRGSSFSRKADRSSLVPIMAFEETRARILSEFDGITDRTSNRRCSLLMRGGAVRRRNEQEDDLWTGLRRSRHCQRTTQVDLIGLLNGAVSSIIDYLHTKLAASSMLPEPLY